MKKLHVLFILGLIASVGFFTSCDEGVDPVGPEIIWSNYDGADLERCLGDEIGITFTVRKGDSKLEDVVVKLGQGVIYTASDDADTDVEDNMEVVLNQTLENVVSQTLTITATDKDGLTDVKTVAINVESDLDDKGTKILGAGGNTNGSYYSLTDDAIMDQGEAQAAPEKVTIVYNNTVDDGAQLYSPTESSAIKALQGTTETLFTELPGVDYATATSVDLPAEADITSTKLTNLSVDDVIAFVATDGTIGIIEVTSIQGDVDGQASISIKTKIVE
ncbi:MAG: hypothetical protein PF481_00205 [Bacteroidales bacterium]|jgi:hypothetical protein|nr:hypothetical protein [Bacteroidales bacterium]